VANADPEDNPKLIAAMADTTRLGFRYSLNFNISISSKMALKRCQ
jgi:hypothetical protein